MEHNVPVSSRLPFKGDTLVCIIVILLVCVSILAVYSSTGGMAYSKQDGDMSYYILHHMKTLGFGIAGLVLFYFIPTRTVSLFATLAMYGAIILLLMTVLFGVSENYAVRRLAIGGSTFQSSDVAKIAIVAYLAKQLTVKRQSVTSWPTVVHMLIPVGLAVVLILPANLSTACLAFASAMILLFIGQVRIKHLFKVVGIAAMAGISLIAVCLLLHAAGLHNPVATRALTWQGRIERFMGHSPEKVEDTSLTTDFQEHQAALAVGTGGLFGKGPGNSTQRHVLPHPYSDFIYAIIIEEYGLIGGILVLLCYIWLFFRTKKIVKNCEQLFPALLAIGLCVNIMLQAFTHMGVAIGVFPITGQPLPFVSMGGSSLLFTGISFGIILRISRENQERMERQERLEQERMEQEERSEIPEPAEEAEGIERQEYIGNNMAL